MIKKRKEEVIEQYKRELSFLKEAKNREIISNKNKLVNILIEEHG